MSVRPRLRNDDKEQPMSATTTDDVMHLLGDHPNGIGLNEAIELLAQKAVALHPLPAISESIMTLINDGQVELTADRQLRERRIGRDTPREYPHPSRPHSDERG